MTIEEKFGRRGSAETVGAQYVANVMDGVGPERDFREILARRVPRSAQLLEHKTSSRRFILEKPDTGPPASVQRVRE